MAGLGCLMLDFPDGALRTVAAPVRLAVLLDGVPARFVPAVIVPTRDHEVMLFPDKLGAPVSHRGHLFKSQTSRLSATSCARLLTDDN